jgi:hypothetical protein
LVVDKGSDGVSELGAVVEDAALVAAHTRCVLVDG